MILRPRLSQLLVSLYLCTSLTSAWPWPPSLPGLEDILVRRQENDQDSAKPSAKVTGSQPSKTGAAASGSQTDKAAATTGKTTASKTSDKSSKSSQNTDDIDPAAGPGTVNLITPATASATNTYYKIGVDSVSFAWNYSSLSVTPSKIDVLVTCTGNQATYTLASNQSYEKTGSVVWDTAKETGDNRLVTDKYTLIIHDSDMALTDRPDAGHLMAFNQYSFGMYMPQKYTPRTEWKCATCNAALSDTERQAIKFMLAMCGITILSFTWFVGGFGALL